MEPIKFIDLLRNHIDISRVPFSDRDSRLLIYKDGNCSCLSVKLAERLTAIDPDIEAYLSRPPFLHHLSLLDENGDDVEFTVTSYPHRLLLHTARGDFGVAFHDERTLCFGFPPNTRAGIRFTVNPQHWKSGDNGGAFKSVRNIAYLSNAQLIRNEIVPTMDGYSVETLLDTDGDTTFAITITPGANLINDVPPFSHVLRNAEERWLNWFSRIPPVQEKHLRMYAYAWWIMGNNLISPLGNIIYEAMTPSKMNYVGLWLWDNAMHALAYRHADPELARNQVRSMLAHQLPNGMLPDSIFDDGIVLSIDHPITGEVTKPPIIAWSIMKIHDVAPDIEFIKEVYVPLVRLNSWWLTMNDDDSDGLAQYNHPYSSGLDDSPLWDYGMPIESPDLNTYLAIQMDTLADMSDLLGLSYDAGIWRRRAMSIVNRMIKDMWDEEQGFFWALKDEQPVPVITPFNLLPLWTNMLPERINQKLLQNLTDTTKFWGNYMLPSVSRADPHYNPETMWRGPVWANVNYFFVEALTKAGYKEQARELREKTLDLIATHDDIYEYYSSETGLPPMKAANIFGWSAAVFIDLAIQSYQDANCAAE